MQASELIKELAGDLPITALKKFNEEVEASEDPQAVVLGFLLVSCNCDEILALLQSQQHTPSELGVIFMSLSYIFLNIADGLTEYTSVGLHISRQLVHNHDYQLYKLLSPSSTNTVSKAALRCITGMVMVGGEAANAVLTALDWGCLNIPLLVNRQSLQEMWDVRAWCIYLFLAFLNATDNPQVIPLFLQKKDILPSIFPGLKRDPSERVINVLKVLHKSVLLNPDVSKTLKIGIFTPASTKSLIELYSWIGPIGKLSQSGEMEELDSEIAEEIKKERVLVREELHQLLLTLCTSIKHGIVFKEKEQVGHHAGHFQSNNWIVYKIVSDMKSPWGSAEESELMSRVLVTFPAILPTYLQSLKEIITPRPTPAFSSAMAMLAQIIRLQEPWQRVVAKGAAGATDCLLPHPLDPPFFRKLLTSRHKVISYAGIVLLGAILSKTKETVENIARSQYLSVEVKQKMKKAILKTVSIKVLKVIDAVIRYWNIVTSDEPRVEHEEQECTPSAATVSQTKQLLNIAKVLTLCRELFSTQVLEGGISPVKMMQHIHVLSIDNADNPENVNDILELKMLCLELVAESKQCEEIMTETSPGQQDQGTEGSILYQLIILYQQSLRGAETDDSLMPAVTNKCFTIISSTLEKVGLSSSFDGSIAYWLKPIADQNSKKISQFLARIIQKTVTSLNHYTDQLIGIKNDGDGNTGQLSSFVSDLNKMDVTDNEDISCLTASLPFSRLVLAAFDIMATAPDAEHIQYFSDVMNNYLYSLENPQYLANMLLKTDNVITPDMQEYLKSWFTQDRQSNAAPLPEGAKLSEILKYLFMTHKWSSVESLLEVDTLEKVMDERELDLVVSQLLLYLQLDSKAEKKRSKMLKRYTSVLNNMSTLLKDKESKRRLIQSVLEHPNILANYKPFTGKKSPVLSLTQNFIEIVSADNPESAANITPYYRSLVKDLQVVLAKKDTSADFWTPVSPFLSCNTILSYAEVEELLMLCIQSPKARTDSLGKLVLETLRLLQKATSAKRKPSTQSMHVLVNKVLEWGERGEEGCSGLHDTLMAALEDLLTPVITTDIAQQLSKEEMKVVLRVCPACPRLCCQLASLHPAHGPLMAHHLRKHHRTLLLPTQAPLLAHLLAREDTASVAREALHRVGARLRAWVLELDQDQEDDTRLLIPHAIEAGVLDKECLTEACRSLYEKVVTARQPPPKKLLTLLPAFHTLAASQPVLPSLGLPQELIALLHVCLSTIRTAYLKEGSDAQLLRSVSGIMVEVVGRVEGQQLRDSLQDNKLWPSYVKQVLRHGLGEEELGPELLHSLGVMVQAVYGSGGSNTALPATTLCQMLVSHSNYLTLMFSRDLSSEKLKEVVVRLQQTLVECDASVCLEDHVPVLLGAYGASMSTLDQTILKLLFTYQKKGCLKNCAPLLWGDAAVAHFGVRSEGLGVFKDPKVDQILELLDMERILHTCYCFNTRLPLEPTEVVGEDRSIYDVRLLLPLMLQLADYPSLSEIDYAESGAVPLGLIALTSHREEVWGLGAAILHTMVCKMEKSKHHRLKLPWLWLVGVVSCGFNGLRRKVPAVTAHFLVQASQVMSQPSHPMYEPILSFLFLRPAFALHRVPELYQFYSSPHLLHHRTHRSFLLSMLSTGIRQFVDFRICKRSYVPTLIMGLTQSPTADTELRVQAIEVLEAMVRLITGAMCLVQHEGLLELLPQLVVPGCSLRAQSQRYAPSSTVDPSIMTAVVRVLTTLWSTVCATLERKTRAERDLPEGEMKEGDKADKEEIDKTKGERTETKRLKKQKRKQLDNTTEGENVEDNREDHGKRKRKVGDTKGKGKKRKKMEKIESDSGVASESDGEASDQEQEEPTELPDTITTPTKKKLLPPLFVHELLNGILIITPAVISNAPLATSAQLLSLLADTVRYFDTIAELSNKRCTLRLTVMKPAVIRNQVKAHINWALLHNNLVGCMSDTEECEILGPQQTQELSQQWRSEPLTPHLQQQCAKEGTEDQAHHEQFKQAVLKLVHALQDDVGLL